MHVLCRQQKTAQAVEFARSQLAPLRSLLQQAAPAYNDMLHDVSAILAYEQPEVRPAASPSACAALALGCSASCVQC